MEPSKHRDCFNAALCLERTWNRLLLRKCLVRARLIVESHVFDEDAPKMVLTEDEDMVEHLSAKRARKALGEGIHVRCAYCGAHEAHAGCREYASEATTEL